MHIFSHDEQRKDKEEKYRPLKSNGIKRKPSRVDGCPVITGAQGRTHSFQQTCASSEADNTHRALRGRASPAVVWLARSDELGTEDCMSHRNPLRGEVSVWHRQVSSAQLLKIKDGNYPDNKFKKGEGFTTGKN